MSTITSTKIYTSQAIADTFAIESGVAILTTDTILVNKNPDQPATNNDFSVTITSIQTEKVLIDSPHVSNLNYEFYPDDRLIENYLGDHITVDENQGTVYIKPYAVSGDKSTTLWIYGAWNSETSSGTGTTNLATGRSRIYEGDTIEIKIKPFCEVRYIYNPVQDPEVDPTTGEYRTDVDNFPYNTTHFFTYKVNGGKDRMAMYEPGAAYYIGTDNQDLPCYFTVSSTGKIGYIVGYGEKPSQSMDTDGREYNSMNFSEFDWDTWYEIYGIN